jgi:ubiquinone/menaquinone biosynthesis C-methylase UbiE
VARSRVPPAWLVRPLIATRNGIARVHQRLAPPEVTIFERSLGIVDTKALAVAADLGIADALGDGPRSAGELASSLGVDTDAVDRLLRFLVGRGVFRRGRDGRYANNRTSTLLREDDVGSLRAWARFFGAPWHVAIWNRLDHSVTTGRAAAGEALGHDFWAYLTTVDHGAGQVFDDAMAAVSRLQQAVIATKYPWPSGSRVCDVGGGTGTLLAAILDANPSCSGVLLDLPVVVTKAGPVLERAGVAGRVELVAGDFFDALPSRCDRYVLEAVIHDWDDDSCARILTRCREALPPGGRVLVLEQTVPGHDGDHVVKAVDLEMLVDAAGRERTRAEFEALFARAGLRVRSVIPIALLSVYELEP